MTTALLPSGQGSNTDPMTSPKKGQEAGNEGTMDDRMLWKYLKIAPF